MATIIERNGRWTIQVFVRGKRETIALGIGDEREARRTADRIERLIASTERGDMPEPDIAGWLAKMGDRMHARLSELKLCKPRGAATLGAFLDSIVDAREKGGNRFTVANFKQARRYLLDHFGKDRDLREITPADAEAFHAALVGKEYAPATVGRTIGRARQFFNAAIRRELVQVNPFLGLSAAVNADPDRQAFIPLEDYHKLIAATPSRTWKCIIALTRIGGLRCPSEVMALKWTDIDLYAKRFTVRASKTKHHADGGVRVVPLFPELEPVLQDAYDHAPEGSTYVVEHVRSAAANLRTHLLRIIDRAGLKPWPKLFQNLRASRATELAEQYPVVAQAAWLGHSPKIALAHYHQVRDVHFDMAASTPTPSDPKRAAPALHSALHSAQQQGILSNGEQVGARNGNRENRRVITSDSATSPLPTTDQETEQVPGTGVERSRDSKRNTPNSPGRAAAGAAPGEPSPGWREAVARLVAALRPCHASAIDRLTAKIASLVPACAEPDSVAILTPDAARAKETALPPHLAALLEVAGRAEVGLVRALTAELAGEIGPRLRLTDAGPLPAHLQRLVDAGRRLDPSEVDAASEAMNRLAPKPATPALRLTTDGGER